MWRRYHTEVTIGCGTIGRLEECAGSRIAPGTYQSSRSTVDFFGNGRSCSDSNGRIVIHSFDYVPENLALRNFRASFEQRCQGTAAALRAEVAILADPWR